MKRDDPPFQPRFHWFLIAVLSVLLAACGGQKPGQNWQKGERGQVVRILDGDTFALNTGQTVRLVSIEAPAFAYRGRAEMPYAEQAKRELERLVLGEEVQLYYPGMTRDQYDRALAQVYVLSSTGKPVWVNEALIAKGAAWVRLYPDTANGSEQLWSVESKARSEHLGLWGERQGPVLKATRKDWPNPGFVIVSGEVQSNEPLNGVCLTRLQLDTKGQVVSIRHDPAGPAGECLPQHFKSIEVRGWMKDGEVSVSRQNIQPAPERTIKP